MKLEKLLLRSTALSVVITSVFFIFAKIGTPNITPAIEIGKYFLILLFSLVIIGATILFSVKKLNKILALLIHYAVSLVAFLLIFVSFEDSRPMRTMIMIVFFTVLYSATFVASIGIKKALQKLDGRTKSKSTVSASKGEYKPRYK